MAALVVAGITVPVARDGASITPIEIGKRERAFDGNMLSSIRARKTQLRIRTIAMTDAAADALEAALEGAPPLACSGDLLGGAVSCHAQIKTRTPVLAADGLRAVLEFDLFEA